MRSACCARAANDHAAAPPSSVMNSRRPMSSIGFPPEAAVPGYRRLRLHRKRRQVLGADLRQLEPASATTITLIGVIGLATLLACAIGYAMSRAIGGAVAQLH